MANETLDQVLVSVAEEDTLIDSVVELMDGLKRRLDEALASENLSAATKKKIEDIFTANEKQKAKIADAIVANTDIPPDA